MAGFARTIEIDDATPEELAGVFAGMAGDDQARFFSTVWKIAREWPGAGWCQQSFAIAEKLDADGRNAITTLAAHVVGDA